MKICPNCHVEMDDAATFCPNCGASVAGAPAGAYNGVPPQGAPQPQYYAGAAPVYDPFDHTAEFDPKDVSDNKVIAMLCYLLGPVGIIIALLASHDSAYAGFHMRQALKFTAVSMIMAIATAALCWTFIVPIFCAVMNIVFFVIKVIVFFQICKGQAKEPAIIRNLSFLK